MTRAGRLAFVIMAAAARPAAAQCGLDQIEAGIAAYRDLDVQAAGELMRGAVEMNDRASSRCATETARALTYLGATYWLLEQPDSARRSFESAVIRAPRFRPDALEFPPDVTDAFDDVRRRTPAVAVVLPDEVEIGPRGEAALFLHLSASAGHEVIVSIRAPTGATVRTLFQGPLTTVAEGLVIEWNGRDSDGRAVPLGRYELEVISESPRGSPLRKVIVPLTVESVVPPTIVAVDSAAVPVVPAVPISPAGQGSVWAGVGAAAIGLVGGAIVIGVPAAVNGFPESGGRYVVGVSLGVAGLAGLVRALRQRPAAPPAPIDPAPAERREAEPTLRVLAGNEYRVELGGGGFEPLGDGGRSEPGFGR